MSKENVLSAMKITGFLFDKGVIKNAPGLAAKDEEINFNGLSAEEFGEIFGYLKELQETKNGLKIPMPFALKIRIARKLVQDMAPERGRISIGHILQGLSFQMSSSYRQIYEMLGLNKTEAKQIKNLFVTDPSDKIITKVKTPLLKIINGLGLLDRMTVERVIYWSFAPTFPENDSRSFEISRKVFDSLKDEIAPLNFNDHLDELPVSKKELEKFIKMLESAEKTDIPMPKSLVEALAK